MNETPEEYANRLRANCELNYPQYHEQQRALAVGVSLICPYCNQLIP